MLLARPSVCEQSTLLPVGHSWPRRRDHFPDCSCSSTHTHTHTNRPVHLRTLRKDSTIYGLKKEKCLLGSVCAPCLLCTHGPRGRPPQPSSRCMTSILGKSNLQFAGMTISLTISTSSLNLLASDCKQVRLEPAPRRGCFPSSIPPQKT